MVEHEAKEDEVILGYIRIDALEGKLRIDSKGLTKEDIMYLLDLASLQIIKGDE